MANALAAHDDDLVEASQRLTKEDTEAAINALRKIGKGSQGEIKINIVDYSKLNLTELKEAIILRILDRHPDLGIPTITRRLKEELSMMQRLWDFELIKDGIIDFFKEYRQQLINRQFPGYRNPAEKWVLSTKERFEQVLAMRYIKSYEKAFLEQED